MASMVSKIVSKSSNCLLANHLAVARQFSALQNRKFHLTPAQDYSHLARNSDGKFMCTLIPGDGVGPELMESVTEVLKYIGAPIDFEMHHLSEVQRGMSADLLTVTESVRRNHIALKGVINAPHIGYSGALQNLNQNFRNSLDLYANVVIVKSLPGVQSRHQDLDFIVIREQTEGEYSALEHESVKGVVECLKVVTEEKSKRIAKFAFDFATRNGRKKVTAVHKANIMKLGDGLFLRSCEQIAQLYPNIIFDAMIIDNCTMQLTSKPQQFDVMVMPNLYGDIIDNLGAGLVGGAGLVAGASFSAKVAVFEPGTRHTYDEGVGKNVANPTAMLLSAVQMLEHIGLRQDASKIRSSINQVLGERRIRTRDLGGFATTSQFTNAIIQNL